MQLDNLFCTKKLELIHLLRESANFEMAAITARLDIPFHHKKQRIFIKSKPRTLGNCSWYALEIKPHGTTGMSVAASSLFIFC